MVSKLNYYSKTRELGCHSVCSETEYENSTKKSIEKVQKKYKKIQKKSTRTKYKKVLQKTYNNEKYIGSPVLTSTNDSVHQ